MRKTTFFAFATIGGIIIMAYSPSKEEIEAREKAKADSIAAAEETNANSISSTTYMLYDEKIQSLGNNIGAVKGPSSASPTGGIGGAGRSMNIQPTIYKTIIERDNSGQTKSYSYPVSRPIDTPTINITEEVKNIANDYIRQTKTNPNGYCVFTGADIESMEEVKLKKQLRLIQDIAEQHFTFKSVELRAFESVKSQYQDQSTDMATKQTIHTADTDVYFTDDSGIIDDSGNGGWGCTRRRRRPPQTKEIKAKVFVSYVPKSGLNNTEISIILPKEYVDKMKQSNK
ncbi:MAG: hypothetical protein Fur0023_16400 [Bacteroidia bacterium]